MKTNLEPVALKELVRNLTEFAVCYRSINIYYDNVRTFLVCVFIENTQMPSSLDEKNAGGRTPPALKVTL